ncbi:signal peptidase [Ectothiorhodospira haloalkaliphila]|uniref:Signal peptidase I n=1 Tax=Ectothiorhodospira haloalkaliphila TaxID=421628 RepID=W8KSY9_9GAMM|nr:signal peptidase I [Ectothiorhodospira haloalkaliphila]AHK78671.1 signal peptidase [Ectothiorhodospira haloalkaliphila]
MTFDLELILVLGTLVTGLVWLADVIWWRKSRMAAVQEANPGQDKRVAKVAAKAQEPWYVDYAKAFLPVLLIVLVLRSFVAEPFRIPSGSMMPTLLVGDFILVSKSSYGIRLPVVRTRIINTGQPQRGDVAVFRYPANPREDYIKRIVGVPGDRVGFHGKRLYINGEPVPQEVLGIYEGQGSGAVMTGARLMEERINGVSHQVLAWPDRQSAEGEVVVPEGHYFALGDNRDNSNDSRFWGFVPEENLVGRALFIWMHWDHGAREMDFSRLGTRIQ